MQKWLAAIAVGMLGVGGGLLYSTWVYAHGAEPRQVLGVTAALCVNSIILLSIPDVMAGRDKGSLGPLSQGLVGLRVWLAAGMITLLALASVPGESKGAEVTRRTEVPPTEVTLSCDWTGDGVKTPGLFRDGTWLVRTSASSEEPDLQFRFGLPGDTPICGDWDGDGTETPGVVRGNLQYLRNKNSTGEADLILPAP
jgi:hypothetical protein